jgi:hypothetical protein
MADMKLTKSRRKKDSSRPTDDVEGYATWPANEVGQHANASPATTGATTSPKVNGRTDSPMRAIDDGERRRMIAEAAYYRAQRRGFANGSPESDWLEAEAEIIELLANAGLRA